MTSTDAENREVSLSAADLARETFRLLAGSAVKRLPRHRHALSREDVRYSQTARILAAAIELFGSHGYAATTVAQIADQAGVSRRTVYDLYESKEAIFLHTYRCTELLMREAEEGAQDDSAPTLESLSEVVTRLLALIETAPEAARMFFLEALGAGPRVRERRNQAIAEFVTAATPRLQRLRAETDPTLPPLTYEVCNAVVASAIELIVQHLVRHGPSTVSAVAGTINQLVRALVGADCHSS